MQAPRACDSRTSAGHHPCSRVRATDYAAANRHRRSRAHRREAVGYGGGGGRGESARRFRRRRCCRADGVTRRHPAPRVWRRGGHGGSASRHARPGPVSFTRSARWRGASLASMTDTVRPASSICSTRCGTRASSRALRRPSAERSGRNTCSSSAVRDDGDDALDDRAHPRESANARVPAGPDAGDGAVGRAHGVNLPPDYAEQRQAFADTVPADIVLPCITISTRESARVAWLSGGVVHLGRRSAAHPGQSRSVGHPRVARGRSRQALTLSVPSLTIRALARRASHGADDFIRSAPSAATVRTAPLLLMDLDTNEGVTDARTVLLYSRCGARRRAVPGRHHGGGEKPQASSRRLWATLSKRYIRSSVEGIVRMAMSLV